ncbi:hypothetical protein AAF712_000170 [Marasmius tenuissimus]|uniref:AMP-dependent synthetase/ligase domain-containing protein n=1 Tax=Marasmius tenuissimus TaxID=585030 RepID=A0ABR3AEQ3_9AGAR
MVPKPISLSQEDRGRPINSFMSRQYELPISFAAFMASEKVTELEYVLEIVSNTLQPSGLVVCLSILFGIARLLSHFQELLGAVTVNVNAWLPIEPLSFCITHTECKLLLVDVERADKLEPALDVILSKGCLENVLVITVNEEEHRRRWRGMETFRSALQDNLSTTAEPLPAVEIDPEDNAVIMFTSGTTGLPKGVLSTQRQFLTNILNTLVGNRRAVLRRGEDLAPAQDDGPQKGALVAVPLFHVTGLTSYSMMATMLGYKIVLMRKWLPEEG